MTSLVSNSSAFRDSLDKIQSLSERLVALCMVAANQENAESIPQEFANAYFEQMGDLADEVLNVAQRLDDDLSFVDTSALMPS